MGVDSRRTHAKAGPDGADSRALPGFGDELLGNGGKLVEVPATGVLQLERKPSCGAKPPDGWSIEGQDQRLGDLGEFSEGCTDEGFHMLVRSLPFIPEVQRHKHRGRIGPPRVEDEVEAGQRIR